MLLPTCCKTKESLPLSVLYFFVFFVVLLLVYFFVRATLILALSC